jgi:actin-related protein
LAIHGGDSPSPSNWAAQETARRQAFQADQERAEEVRKHKAEKLEARRAEERAKLQAEERAREEAARQEAEKRRAEEEEVTKRLAENERLRREAIEEEKQRRIEEQEKAVNEERKRLWAEEISHRTIAWELCKTVLETVVLEVEKLEREKEEERVRAEARRRELRAQCARAEMARAQIALENLDFDGARSALTSAQTEWDEAREDMTAALASFELEITRQEQRLGAAYTMQRWIRRSLAVSKARKRLLADKLIRSREAAARLIQNNVRIRFAKLDACFMGRFQMNKEAGAIKIQALHRSISARQKLQVERLGQNNHAQVVVIQKAYRCHFARSAYISRSSEVYHKVASGFASIIQTNMRQCLARRRVAGLRKAITMMQQWVTRYCWKHTVDLLTKVAAQDWSTICMHMTLLYGRQEAFSRTQALAPAILPSWWLSHFPLSITKRVNLKKEPLVALDHQIRRDRTDCLGANGDFRVTFGMLSSLVDQLTGGARVRTLDLSDSYGMLISLIVFCNLRASDLVDDSLKLEMLKYAQRLCDGPDFACPGLSEKLEYKQWTLSNLCRVSFAMGQYDKAAEYGRMIETVKTGNVGRDQLIRIMAQIYVAVVHSKQGKHNTALLGLEKNSSRLARWCASNSQRSWTSFCSSRIVTRRYICTATHLAGVCQYNLSIEYAAVNRMAEALEASKRACALSARDEYSEPIFLRRCKRTLFALESIAWQARVVCDRPLPAVLHRLMAKTTLEATSPVADENRTDGSRASTASSSIRSKVQTIKDSREAAVPSEKTAAVSTRMSAKCKRNFGLWFPPHVALRLVPQSQDEFEAGAVLEPSDTPEIVAVPSIFLRTPAAGSAEIVDDHPAGLLLLALPMEHAEAFEVMSPDSIALQRLVLQNLTEGGFKEILRVQKSIAHAPSKLEKLASLPMRQRMMGLIIVCVQAASKIVIASQDSSPESGLVSAAKYVTVAEALLFNGTFDNPHFIEMKAYARLLHSVCYSLEGQGDKALWILTEVVAELGLDKHPRIHAVVLLNKGALLGVQKRYRQAFEACDEAFTIIQTRLKGHRKEEDW